jgi:hypothetical protein
MLPTYNRRLRSSESLLCIALAKVHYSLGRMTLVFYRRRAFEKDGRVGAMLWRAFDKTV